MLFRTAVQQKIRDGEITLAFRRWKQPRVKPGTSHKSGFGMIAIGKVEKSTQRKLTDAEARKAGYTSKTDLLDDLADREGDLYRIEVANGGADPRVALRESDDLSEDEFLDISKRLERMDRGSKTGAWTRSALEVIDQNPKRRAGTSAIWSVSTKRSSN